MPTPNRDSLSEGYTHAVLAWLLLMEPFRLHENLVKLRMNGRAKLDHSLFDLSPEAGTRRALTVRLLNLLIMAPPLLTIAVGVLVELAGESFSWDIAIAAVGFGVGFGLLISIGFDLPTGVSWGILLSLASGILFGVEAIRVFLGDANLATIIGGVVLGIAFEISSVTAHGSRMGLFHTSVWCFLGGALFLLGFDVARALLFILLSVALRLRLPLFLVESTVTLLLVLLPSVMKIRYSSMIAFLPFRYHEMIYFPLPGLRAFLLRLTAENGPVGDHLIEVAASRIAQRRSAHLVVIELQARSLESAAAERLYDEVAGGEIPRMIQYPLPENDILSYFSVAANELRAASRSRNHQHRRRVIERAAEALTEAELRASRLRWPRSELKRFLITVATWREHALERERRELARDEILHPQVPRVFKPGPVLGPENRTLFKGRQDLIALIDHDLAGAHRAAIFLFGQRRMGKSSLLNMLPAQLGRGTLVGILNFQGLSGVEFRSQPHRWIGREIRNLWPHAEPSPDSPAWRETLDWMSEIDRSLRREDRRMLIALDEVERLEDGIRQGWANTDLLDLVRAAGDTLEAIRFLLASARSLRRLGPHWVDRLINVLPRELQPLGQEHARDLMCNPVPDFPDIYPEGGVDLIFKETCGHPFLIQLVCDFLCIILNDKGEIRASAEDLERAVGRSVKSAAVFQDLWNDRTGNEREVLQDLASQKKVGRGAFPVCRALKQEGYVAGEPGSFRVAIPMFSKWIDRNG